MAKQQGLMNTQSNDETKKWLKENGLSDIVSIFQQQGLTKQLFIEANTTQIQQLCNAYNINMKYELKLKSVLKKIPSSAMAQESKRKTVDLTTKEKESITKSDIALKHNEKDLEEQKNSIDIFEDNEELIEKVQFIKLYQFDQDISNKSCWKTRISQSTVFFYKSNENGKIRMIAKEYETNKLRMNQFVPTSDKSYFELKQRNVYQWIAYDIAIAQEQQNDVTAITTWCIQFESHEKADLFAINFQNASKINESIQKTNTATTATMIQETKEMDKFVFSDIKLMDGVSNEMWGNDKSDNLVFGTFGDSSTFKVDVLISENNNDKKDNDEDNFGGFNLYQIVNLQEVDIETGHENDVEMEEFGIIKLYRWGKDVLGQQCWKNRACNTKLKMYRDKYTDKIRLVCRENITYKLRLNHWIAPSKWSNIKKRNEKEISWTGFDTTIEEEDKDLNNGYCMFAAKFIDGETAIKFYNMFISATESNQNQSVNLFFWMTNSTYKS